MFKSRDLELMRLVLAAGTSVPPHKVAGEITVHCIEGRLDVSFEGKSHVLGAGQMLLVAADVVHGVTALDSSSALVTVALRP